MSVVLGVGFYALSSLFALVYIKNEKTKRLSKEAVTYHGSCHCGKVTFTVDAPRHLVVWDCNCSICLMKKNWHFIVPSSGFKLLTGKESITEYKFNTKVARHTFCSSCGVQPFYYPRSNPDGLGITLSCIIPQTQVLSYEIRRFDGNNWENFFGSSGISGFSKEGAWLL